MKIRLPRFVDEKEPLLLRTTDQRLLAEIYKKLTELTRELKLMRSNPEEQGQAKTRKGSN
ncbi:hypothetical protein CEE39_08500 [bacterium (candidate division B38) B3_B38]|nr:MAG: hypothetical protein CEE39_08500 [bacterium (candidate division B38) B3_B38]